MLVIVLGPETAGYMRLIDVAIGAAIGLLLSQVLIAPPPVAVAGKAASGLLQRLASAFYKCAEALARSNAPLALSAVEEFSAADDDFGAGITRARLAVCWSIRRYFSTCEATDVVSCLARWELRLHAATLLFGEALADALRQGEAPPPHALRERIEHMAALCSNIANGRAPSIAADQCWAPSAAVAPSWRDCLTYLVAVETALQAFGTATIAGAGR